MQVKFSIPRSHIPAALLFAGNNDVRYYLNGALFEVYPERVFIVATDGHRMGMLRSEPAADDPVPTAPVQFIAPRDLLANIKAKGHFPISVEYDSDSGMVTLDDCGTRYSAKATDGRFPDWRRVMPLTPSGRPAQYNVDYIADLSKLARVLGCKYGTAVKITHDGRTDDKGNDCSGGALVTIADHPEFVGVLMSIRGPGPAPTEDALRARIAAPEQAKAAPLKLAA